jgi:hypothetical protein
MERYDRALSAAPFKADRRPRRSCEGGRSDHDTGGNEPVQRMVAHLLIYTRFCARLKLPVLLRPS